MTIQPKSQDAVAWTGECPITYVDLDTPQEPRFEGQKPQYKCTVLIDKQDKATLKAVGEAIEVAKNKLTDTDPAEPFAPLLKDGDERTDKNGDPVEAFRGKWYFTAKNSERPNVYKLTDKGVEPAGDKEVTNWDKGQVVVYFSAYDFEGRKGISVRLLGFCKTGTTRELKALMPADAMFGHLGATAPQPLQTGFDSDAQFSSNDDLPF
ncbi:ssDNA-binding protein [Porphyromonas endodontalis]|uniref:ssDNA-binding protein n=1 Tax=Porphyromonas endodontalis TaxID=28124 RepID=UPI003C7C6363